MSCVPLVLLAVLAAPDAASSPAPDAVATQIERVASAYDQGNCTEVLAAIRSLPNPEQDLALDGLSQYRWGFCLGLTGQGDPNSHYTAAADILGLELKSRSPRLDAFFYRVNALQNLKRADEATATAKDAIARWKAGTLTAPAGAPASWFQLGKLFVDGGDPKGAAAHYRRALDAAAESKRPLRSVYTERIADFALAHKDTDLARKAVSALSAADPDSLSTIERSGRLLLALGDVAGARDQFRKAGRIAGEAAVEVQYMASALDRVLELNEWGEKPRDTLPNGKAISGLSSDELQAALRDCATDFRQVQGPVVEVPRPKGPGTRPAPHPAVARRLHEVQARFAGLLLEALRRQATLQEWSVPDGYAQLIRSAWAGAFMQRADPDRSSQLIDLGKKR